MADQEVIKHVKHAVEVARDKRRPWAHRLQEILLEIIIIVFAVSLSIWLHNWAESRKDREEEREFLVGLREDLKADILEMKSDQGEYQRILNGIGYFTRVGRGEPGNKDSLRLYQTFLFSSIQIDPRVARFEALRGSGRLGIIRDNALLVNIADLYIKNFPHLRRLNEVMNTMRTERLLSFFAAHVQLDPKNMEVANIEEFLRMSETRILISALQSAALNIEDYERVIHKSNLIITLIDKNLE